MANKYTQYGAVVAGAVAIPAAVGGISAAASTFSFENAWNNATGTGSVGGAAATAADAGTSAFSSSVGSTLNNPAFMTGVGLGLVGLALGSGSKMPSLNLPNLAATAAVALSVSSLLKQGKAAAAGVEKAGTARGGAITSGSSFKNTTAVTDPNIRNAIQRQYGQTMQLTFPKTLGSEYWIRFSVRKYDRLASKENASNKLSDFHTMIKLPLPSNLVDALKLSYQELGMGVFGGPMMDVASDAYNAFNASGGTTAQKFGAASTAGLKGMSGILQSDGAKSAIARKLITNSTMGAAFDMISGNAPNPHMAVTFNGVNLKKHQFTWRFSPDSYAESKDLEAIIRQLQAAALPGTEGAYNLLLSFPDIVVIEMNPSNLIPFKPCAIDSVGVNYAPNGVPSFFRPDRDSTDGKRYPTEVELTIILREMDIHTNNMPFYDEARQGQREYYDALSPTNAIQTSEAEQARDTTSMMG